MAKLRYKEDGEWKSMAPSQKEFDDLANQVAQDKLDYIQQRQQDNLKVAKVEKDLTDYQKTLSQVNVNQEAKQRATGYGVVNLPKNAANGQVSVTIGGQTWTNLIDGAEVAPDDSRTFDSIDGHIYFDLYNGVIIAGDGAEKTVINAGDESANMAVFDLTQIYGQGNEPTAEQAQARLYYINDTKSTVGASRLKSVGKNLWALDNEWKIKEVIDGLTTNKINGYVNATTLLPVAQSNIPINKRGYKQNTRYTIQAKVKGSVLSIRIYYTDGTDEIISWASASFANKVSTTALGKTVRAIGFSTGSDKAFAYIAEGTFQLEENIQATPYEPYTESTQYIIAKDKDNKIVNLRSLPNGTKDEVRVSEGKLIKRVKQVIVTGANILSVTARTNVQDVAFRTPDSVRYSAEISGQATVSGRDEVSTTDRDLISSIGKFYTNTGVDTTANYIRILLDKNLYPTQQDCINFFNANPQTLTYQLATPVEIPIQVSGTLLSNPSGTVYVEPVVADAGVYTDKMEVLHQDLPIKALEKLSKVDFMTGVETELDIDGIVIAENKLSFTHPELQDGDIVFFEYEYDVESTQGEAEIEYYDSRYTIKDSVTDKFYKWNVTVTDGVPSIELVEV